MNMILDKKNIFVPALYSLKLGEWLSRKWHDPVLAI